MKNYFPPFNDERSSMMDTKDSTPNDFIFISISNQSNDSSTNLNLKNPNINRKRSIRHSPIKTSCRPKSILKKSSQTNYEMNDQTITTSQSPSSPPQIDNLNKDLSNYSPNLFHSISWDEENLLQNELEKVPRMIIDEPPTPYRLSITSQLSSSDSELTPINEHQNRNECQNKIDKPNSNFRVLMKSNLNDPKNSNAQIDTQLNHSIQDISNNNIDQKKNENQIIKNNSKFDGNNNNTIHHSSSIDDEISNKLDIQNNQNFIDHEEGVDYGYLDDSSITSPKTWKLERNSHLSKSEIIERKNRFNELKKRHYHQMANPLHQKYNSDDEEVENEN